jgi:Concanavalin A-like lectin/glucanases superfamily
VSIDSPARLRVFFPIVNRSIRRSPRGRVRLVAVLLAAAGRSLAAGDPAPAPPVLWKLDSLRSIGGHAPEVLGAPRVTAGTAVQFNGVDDGLILPVDPLAGWREFTIEALIRPETGGAAEQRFLHIEDAHGHRATMEIRLTADGRWALDTFLLGGGSRRTLLDRTRLHPADRWTWVALRYDGRQMTSFVNGVMELEGPVDVSPFTAGRTALGVRLNRVYWFRGAIREVRFEARALEASDLQQTQ